MQVEFKILSYVILDVSIPVDEAHFLQEWWLVSNQEAVSSQSHMKQVHKVDTQIMSVCKLLQKCVVLVLYFGLFLFFLLPNKSQNMGPKVDLQHLVSAMW